MLSSLINRLEAELPEAIREDRGSKKERKKGKNGRKGGGKGCCVTCARARARV